MSELKSYVVNYDSEFTVGQMTSLKLLLDKITVIHHDFKTRRYREVAKFFMIIEKYNLKVLYDKIQTEMNFYNDDLSRKS